ncbi:hypothetical protein Scep_020028 [Stephania cephalantha]|uniref:C2H2-type domain-containing protein n=1 Tax=Stephania cephalantha TaxID=152367 RepID=A0AAP0NNK1_9MAGN
MNNEDTSKVDDHSPNSSPSSPLKQESLFITPTQHHQQQQEQEHKLEEEDQDRGKNDFTSLESHKKKRSKVIRIGGSSSTTSSSCEPSKPPKAVRKPEPNAPKITPPCTECGRRFWSLKALFGHMRCHPERQWRGINPPPNLPRPSSSYPSSENVAVAAVRTAPPMFTEEDHEVAESLLLLASGTGNATTTTTNTNTSADHHHHHLVASEFGSNNLGGIFECSSCKKVFGSHQALGGHRASHKNVKGCFAIARNDQCEESNLGTPISDYHHHQQQQHYHHNFCGDPNKFIMKEISSSSTSLDLGNINNNNHHQCSICFRVFSSGQALGGHKRCHWEKGEESSSLSQLGFAAAAAGNRSWDLNLPAPVEMSSGGDHREQGSSSSSSDLDLGLSLGI